MAPRWLEVCSLDYSQGIPWYSCPQEPCCSWISGNIKRGVILHVYSISTKCVFPKKCILGDRWHHHQRRCLSSCLILTIGRLLCFRSGMYIALSITSQCLLMAPCDTPFVLATWCWKWPCCASITMFRGIVARISICMMLTNNGYLCKPTLWWFNDQTNIFKLDWSYKLWSVHSLASADYNAEIVVHCRNE